MTLATKGYGSRSGVLATYGFGDLLIPIIVPFAFASEVVTTKFTKLNGVGFTFVATDDTDAFMERIIAEATNDPVQTPDDLDLIIIPSVSVSFGGFDRVEADYETLNTIEAFMIRVVSEEPIVQGFPGDNNDLQIIPTVSVSYQKSNPTATIHEISNKINTIFERIVAEEVS